MTDLSLLHDRDLSTTEQVAEEVLVDLNLDQVLDALFPGPGQDELRTVFRHLLPDAAAVQYRLDVFRDLDDDEVHRRLDSFGRSLRGVDKRVATAATTDPTYEWHERVWLLEAMTTYVDAVVGLTQCLQRRHVRSLALTRLRDHLVDYCATPTFQDLASGTARVREALSGVAFGLRIEGERVTVGPALGGEDFAAEVRGVLAPFLPRDEDETAEQRRQHHARITPLEARAVRLVVRQSPEPFQALAAHCARHATFVDPVLLRVADEAEFYLAVRRLTDPLVAEGMPRCYPELVAEDQATTVRDGHDLALALTGAGVVGNDVVTEGLERQLVVTGANQGGKTTFARMVGQLHHLAAIGMPVPATTAHVRLVDAVHTHFEGPEELADEEGRLVADLRRLDRILRRASPRSVVILNELFSSTSYADARDLGHRVLHHLSEVGALTVFVTFVDELATTGPQTVSLVAQVMDDDSGRRTYRVVRQPPVGVAHADALARRHGLGHDQVVARVRS